MKLRNRLLGGSQQTQDDDGGGGALYQGPDPFGLAKHDPVRKRREKQKQNRAAKRRRKRRRTRSMQQQAASTVTDVQQQAESTVADVQKQSLGSLSAAAGRTIVNTATGGRADELRAQYRQSQGGRQQFERSRSNIQRRRDPIGQAGALVEAGTDFALDFPGASVQNRAAESAGGRESIAERYQQTATATDEALSTVGADTRTNRVSKALSEFVVAPVVKGTAATVSGTDVETGAKVNARGEDITEAALLPFAVTPGSLGGKALARGSRLTRRSGRAAARGAGRTARKAADAARETTMVNPARFLSGILRRGDEATDISRTSRRISSSDNLPVPRESPARLESLSTGPAARQVEQAQDTRRSTGLDTLRSSRGGTGSQQLFSGDNLPARLDELDIGGSRRTGSRTSGVNRRGGQQAGRSSRFANDDVIDMEESASGVFRSLDRGEDVATASRTASQAGESGSAVSSALSGLRSLVPTAATGGRRAGGAAASAGRRAGRTGSSLADRVGALFRRGDETTTAGRAGRQADETGRAGRVGRVGRQADETGRAGRAGRQADETTAAGRAGRQADEAGGLLSRLPGGNALRRFVQNNPGTSIIGGGILGGVAAGALMRPPSTVQGDGWTAQHTKDYTVQTSDGQATVYQYEVYATGGQQLGYTVITGMDDEGRLYYLGGNTDRPAQSKSRVSSQGLERAADRAAEQAAVTSGGGR